MKKLLIILFVIISLPALATKYYVKNGGSDAADGLSDGNAWETISKVNGETFSADDTIAFKSGDTWRETLNIPSSGSVGQYIVFTSYGAGVKPRILGSELALSFTNVSGNVWESATSLSDPNAGIDMEIFFRETDDSVKWGEFQTYIDLTELTEEYDWTWNSNTIYVYAATDPDTRYTDVEVPQRERIIYLNDKDYIEINGFELAYSVSGVIDHYSMPIRTGYTLRYCHIHHMGDRCADCAGYGTHVLYNDVLIEYDTIHDCGRRGAALYNYMTDTAYNITVHHCVFYNGTHTTGVDMSTGTLGFAGGIDSVWIYNNSVYDPPDADEAIPSVSMYFDGSAAGDGEIHNLWFYNNIMMWTSANALRLSEIYNSYVYNNTFYEQNTNTGAALLAIDFGGPSEIKNNIFYTTFPDEINFHGLAIQVTSISSAIMDVDYNLVYRPNSAHMIYYDAPNTTSYSIDDWEDIKTDLGWELNSPNPADPLFIGLEPITILDSLMIDTLSSAIDSAIGLGVYTIYDFRDSLRGAIPDIGAYEYAGTAFAGPDPPIVSTSTPSYVYTRLGTSGGNVTDDGGGTVSARGVCWSTSSNPTTSDSKTSDGTGTGSFSSYIISLTAGVTYHVRSYATNETETTYGADMTFTTPIKTQLLRNSTVVVKNDSIVVIY